MKMAEGRKMISPTLNFTLFPSLFVLEVNVKTIKHTFKFFSVFSFAKREEKIQHVALETLMSFCPSFQKLPRNSLNISGNCQNSFRVSLNNCNLKFQK